MSPWITYFKERSPIVPLLVMSVGIGLSGEALAHHKPEALPTVASIFALMLFFFLARLMDEKKDFAKDQIAHPQRPLPRGLLTVAQVERAIGGVAIFALAMSVVFGALFGLAAGALYAVTTAYLWLMYREFYVGHALAEHPVYYAITHQIVIIPLYGFTVSVVSHDFAAPFSRLAVGYYVANLGFNMAYEVSRKLDPSADPVLKTYLKVLGRPRTLVLIYASLVVGAVGSVLLGLPKLGIGFAVYVALVVAFGFVKTEKFKWVEGAAVLGGFFAIWSAFAAFELGWL